MKIISIEFKNINSFKGIHQIDFSRPVFTQNPLFAITGPTGSGKTTILDVICLALFNETPRLGKISSTTVEEKGYVLTRNQMEAYAQVNYTCAQGKFASVWNIHKASSGRVQPHTMEITDLDTGLRMDLKNSEVPGKNEELIGLNYAQFVKSVLLAQGEFAEFLKAAKKDRSELLEKITGTGIYRELGKLAYERFKTENQKIEEEIKLLELEKAKLLSEEEEQLHLKRKVELDKEIAEADVNIKKREEQLHYHKEFADIHKQIEEKTHQIESEKKRHKSFNSQYADLLLNHEKVQEYAAELQQWKIKTQQIKELKNKKAELEQNDKQLTDEKRNQLKIIADFVGQETEENRVESVLNDFYSQVSKLQNEQKDFSQQYKTLSLSFAREIEDLDLGFQLIDFMENPQQWNTLIVANQEQIEYYSNQFGFLNGNEILDKIQNQRSLLEKIRSAQKEQRQIRGEEEGLKKEVEKISDLRAEIELLPSLIAKLETRENTEKIQLENLRLQSENQKLRAGLKELRMQLKENEPCPLCGSLAHPFAAHFPQETSDLQQQIQEMTERYNTTLKGLSKNKTVLEEKTNQLNAVKKDLEERTERLELAKKDFEKDYQNLSDLNEEDWGTKITSVENQIEKLQAYLEFEKSHIQYQKAQPIFEESQKVYADGIAKKKEVDQLYKGKDLLGEVRKLESDWKSTAQQIQFVLKQIGENQQQIDKVLGEMTAMQKVVLPQIKQVGFNDFESAISALMRNQEYVQLKQELQKIEKSIAHLSAQIESEKNRQNKIREQIDMNTAKETLLIEKENLSKKISEYQKESNELYRLLKNNSDSKKKINELAAQINRLNKDSLKWKLLNKMIGSANGDKFNEFAQDLTLKHLLRMANQQLKKINKRYVLMLNDNDKDNLVVADMDMGGQQRSVKTLSGGETFLMSLSLALALSELASRNIHINSLFIDEGFGTLDPETLDQTLDTLERLQTSSSKTIGIISHVDSLKERIATQIKVVPNGQGYSVMEVAGLYV